MPNRSATLRTQTLNGRRVLITGANGGLGQATSLAAVREGAEVILACRTADKAAATQRLVAEATGRTAIAAGGFDMMDPPAIDDAVAALDPAPIDVVFLQAGGWVWADETPVVALGEVTVEATVAKNVVGAHATLRALMATGRLAAGARVVMIGGEGARGVPGAIRPPSFDTVEALERHLVGRGEGAHVPIDALGIAKLCAALWVQHLATLTTGQLEVLWMSPGLIGGTGGTAGMPRWKEWLFQRLAFPLLVALGKAQWPDAAADKCVDALAGRVGHHGDLLGAPEGTALGPLTDQKPMSPLFTDEAMQRAVWSLCERAAGSMPLSQPLQRSA